MDVSCMFEMDELIDLLFYVPIFYSEHQHSWWFLMFESSDIVPF